MRTSGRRSLGAAAGVLGGAVLIVATLLSGCSAGATSYWPDGRWRRSSPEAQGMSSEGLAELFTHVENSDLPLHGLMVVRHGYVVTEAYWYPFRSGLKHDLASCTKSVTSALVGIALREGFLNGTRTPVVKLFPEESVDNRDPRMAAVTIDNILTMSSGLDWPEWDSSVVDPQNPSLAMIRSADEVDYFLGRPMRDSPGRLWNYNSGGSHLLSIILGRATGMDTLEYARSRLFEPLGIRDVTWARDPNGIPEGGGGLRMTLPDMARFGYLYLRGGVWNGRAVVPPEWVSESTGNRIRTSIGYGYGYQWWLPRPGTYAAYGRGGQFIFVVPKLDLVAVFAGGLAEDPRMGEPTPVRLLADYLIPAVRSSGPLRPNPAAGALLEERIAKLALPLPSQFSQTPGDLSVSGKTYNLAANSIGLRACSLHFTGRDEARFTLYFQDRPPLELAVGLAGLYSVTPNVRWFGPLEVDGPIGARGGWQPGRVFTVAVQPLGLADELEFAFNFQGSSAIITLTLSTDHHEVVMIVES